MMTGRRPAAALAALVAYLAGAIALYAGTWRDPFHLSTGGNGDPEMSMWFLQWDALSLARHWNPLYTDLVNHPAGINLMWNPARFLQGWLLAPVTLWQGPVFSYNLSQVLALGLSAWTAYLLLAALTGNRPAAFAGGLLYGFSPYMVGHAPIHTDFTFLPIPPLVLYAFWRLGRGPGSSPVRWGLVLGLLGAGQFLAAEEVAATMALLALLGVGMLAFFRGLDRELLGRGLTAVLVAAAVAGLLLALPAGYQFLGPQVPRGDFHGPGLYVSDLLGFVVPTATLRAYPGPVFDLSAHFAGGPAENTAYLGLPLLALLAWVAWSGRALRLVRWSGAMLVITALLSLGPLLQVGGRLTLFPLPWLIFQFLPLYRDVLTSRLMAFAYLFAAILLAWFIANLPAGGRARTVALSLLALTAVSLLPSAPLPTYRREVPAFFTAERGELTGRTVLVAPFASDPGLIKASPLEVADPMLWQAASGMAFAMPEGYAWAPGPGGVPYPGPGPSRTQDLVARIGIDGGYRPLCQADKLRVLAELRSWGVSEVVVGPMRHRAEMVGFFTDLLGGPPEVIGGVDLWRSLPVAAAEGCSAGS